MNVLFDMETGDPDDLITLLLLLANPDVQLRGVTCWQGSPIQIGLIKHVLSLANLNIPVGGLNEKEPSELSPYYQRVVGVWESSLANQSPNDVFDDVLLKYPDTKILTGAPLTNLANFIQYNLTKEKPFQISSVTSQGGYLGSLVLQPLNKFLGKKEIRTYNLTSDTDSFSIVNNANIINDLTYVTKDLCHGFLYTPDLHSKIFFGSSPIQKLLQSCLNNYASAGKSKAMHDPLAMLVMLYPEISERKQIEMSFRLDEKSHAVFSSKEGFHTRYGLIFYDKNKAWTKFINLCELNHLNNQTKLKTL